jgi:hypothetical protein
LKNLEGQVVESYVDGWKSYWKLVTDVARDPGSLQSAQNEYLTHIAQSAPNQVSKTLQAGAQLYGALIQSGGQIASQIYTQTAQEFQRATNVATEAVSEAATSGAHTATPSEFSFEGFVGETIGKRFLVANKSLQPVTVALAVSAFVPEPVDTSLHMDFVPQTFALAAGEEKVVECRVTIPATLASMTVFRAVLSAAGVPSLSLGLNVKSLGEREVVIEDAPGA